MRHGLNSLWIGAVISACATAFAIAAEGDPMPHRVLIVYENESTQPAAAAINRGLHRGLNEKRPTEFEIYSEYLDHARFPGAGNLDRMAGHLAAKYRGRPIDAVIALGSGALEFMLDHRDDIAPGAPLLFGAVRSASVADGLPADVRGVVSDFDLPRTMALARQLHPDIRKAVIITGSGAFDRAWAETARGELGDSYAGFAVNYLSGLTLEGFVEAARKLSPDTVAVILNLYSDAAGRNLVPRDAAAKIAEASSAPTYAVYDSFVGTGIVGGHMDTFEGVGTALAGLATKVLAGDTDVPAIVRSTSSPILDWRQVTRWGISPDTIPADAVIRFREPSLWQDYQAEILSALAVILLQAALIAALILQGRRRKRAEEEVALGRLELAHLSRASLLGELSGAFAHELNQPLTAILANAEAGRRMLARAEPDTSQLMEILSEIAQDDRRAADVICQLRRLLVKGEASLEPVDLNQVVTATLALAKSELVARQTRIDFKRMPGDVQVLGNFAQLQQIVLNLIVNATEATSKLPAPNRLVEIGVGKRDDGFRELAVADNGPGLTAEMRRNAFEPFVSTKAGGLGLGLAICRSIASAHGGTLQFDAGREKGARVVLTLPARGLRHG